MFSESLSKLPSSPTDSSDEELTFGSVSTGSRSPREPQSLFKSSNDALLTFERSCGLPAPLSPHFLEQATSVDSGMLQRQAVLGDCIKLLESVVSPEAAEILLCQARSFPIIKRFIQEIRAAYSSILDGGKLENAIELRQAFSNLLKISTALSQQQEFPIDAWNSLCEEDLTDVMSGHAELQDQDVDKWLKAASYGAHQNSLHLCQPLLGMPQFSEQDLLNLRVQQAMRRTKGYLASQKLSELKHSKEHSNLVIPIEVGHEGVDSFVKISKELTSSPSTMECFVYDAICAMDEEGILKPHFALTTPLEFFPADVFSGNVFDPDSMRIAFIDPTGDWKVRYVPKGSKQSEGSFQLPLDGQLLNQRLNSASGASVLPKEALIVPTLLQVALGMMDAHGENVICHPDGRLQYFDNTLSFPHSNEGVDWGGLYRIPFRSQLLACEGSYLPLRTEERQLMEEEIELWMERYDRLVGFLQRSDVQERLASLPEGWWVQKKVLEAMYARLQAMQSAIRDPQVENLRDFVMACYPRLRFYALCHLWAKGNWLIHNFKQTSALIDFQKNKYTGLCTLGYESIEELLIACLKKNGDLEVIEEIAARPHLRFEEALQEMNTRLGKVELNPHEQQRFLHAFLSKLTPQLEVDLKDRSGSKHGVALQHVYLKSLYRLGLPVLNGELSKLGNIPFGSTVLALREESCNGVPKYILAHRDMTGAVTTYPLDFSELLESGQICVKLAESHVFLADHLAMLNEQMPEWFFPSISGAQAYQWLMEQGGWLCRRADANFKEKGHLVLSCYRNGKVSDVIVRFGPDGSLYHQARDGKWRSFAKKLSDVAEDLDRNCLYHQRNRR